MDRPTESDVVVDYLLNPMSSGTNTRDKELVETYRTLKRRYHELEEETSPESQAAGERNVKRREEQSYLLDSMKSIEREHPGIQDVISNGTPSFQSSTSSVPQVPLATRDHHTPDQSRNGEYEHGGNEMVSHVEEGSHNLHNGIQTNHDPSQGNIYPSHTSSSIHHQSSGHSPDGLVAGAGSQHSYLYSSASSSQGQILQLPVQGSPSHSSPLTHPFMSPPNTQTQFSHVVLNSQPQQGSSTDENGQGSLSRAPASGPSRSTRRGGKTSAVDHAHNGGGNETGSGPAPKTRGAAKRKTSSPVVKARLTRSDTAALAAAAAKAAEAEAATSSSSTQNLPSSVSGQQLTPTNSNSPIPGEHHTTSSNPNIDPSLVGAETNGAHQNANKPPPMEDIVKVAEAAIAAQKAAAAASTSQTPSTAPSTSATPTSSRTPPVPSANAASSSSSSTSYNPYMITTQMLPGKINTGMPLSMNPYAMYYAPGTPVTPGASPYSPYGNPYYYMTAPGASPSGMYPSSPSIAQPNAQRPSAEGQRQKPKRLKAHTVTSKSFSIPMVPRDKQGKPMLPLNVGIMTVINLGDVCMREHFHTERYIFPVGYEVTRRYLSTVDPNVEVVYHCTILDGGDGPKFQIVPSDVPDRPVIAGTATGAWSSIVKQANAIRNRQHSNSVSGPDFFGLGQNTIKHLIQELPNADRLRDYVWQTFVEGGPLGGRHAAVIPALPEEYDASMPIGAYYPTERDKRRREAAGAAEASTPKGISHYPQHIIAQAEAQRAQQQALQQAQQIGSQPLQPGEPLVTGQQQAAPQAPTPQIDTNLMNFQEYRPQLAASADRTPQALDGSGTGGNTPPGTGSAATFASIMNAYPAGPGSGAPTPAQ